MADKIGIVGAGLVGATSAYAMALGGMASEIVFIDLNKNRAEGEALDIAHAMPLLPPANVYAGEYPDLAGARIVIIAAGASQKPNESRLELARKNLSVMDAIAPEIARYAPESVIIVVTNPVDVLARRVFEASGFPPSRVMGSGTVLDTSRLRYLLSRHTRVDPRNVHAYVIGEHGDSEVPVWSGASIAGMSINEYCSGCGECSENLHGVMDRLFNDEVRNAAYSIIDKKGATYYAVGVAVARIARAVLRDERSILTVSARASGQYGLNGVFLGLPSIIGKNGVERVLEIKLSPAERAKLAGSAEKLEEIY